MIVWQALGVYIVAGCQRWGIRWLELLSTIPRGVANSAVAVVKEYLADDRCVVP